MSKILIIGATSTIAIATARLFSAEGSELFLVARNADKLDVLCADLKTRGASAVHSRVLDITDSKQHESMIKESIESMSGLDIVLIAHGTLPDQRECQQSWDKTYNELNINCLSILSLLTLLANHFEQERHGTIAVISSVAGDRGRQSNYIYGTAKGAVSVFMQGLRNRLFDSNVQVLTIKPGFVDTPMTKDFPKGPLWAQPEAIAKGIQTAIFKKKNVVYLPWFWRFIMLIILHIPEFIFKKLKL
ncbi:MAG: SDR family oxidoreductase [Gammaproteobacteria bacterium]|nr:SDR family oxidoreductase [Gammaproteobacteria bacterium]